MNGTTYAWQVTAVFDPDGSGRDFAYTVGLHDLGMPELHLWARPTDGDDPGSDFALSMQDRAALLNQWAQDLLDGRLRPGDTRVIDLDGGAARAEFTAGAPIPPQALNAYQVDGGATVIPMRWTLHRVPIGPRRPLRRDEAQRVRFEAGHVAGDLGPFSVPPAWRPGPVTCSLDQPFGPRHALVVARGAQVVSASAARLTAYLGLVLGSTMNPPPAYVRALVAARARPLGMVDALEAIAEAVPEIVDTVAGATGSTARWRDVLALVDPQGTEADRADLSDGVREVLAEAVIVLLDVEALGSDVDDDLRRSVTGPWLLSTVSG